MESKNCLIYNPHDLPSSHWIGIVCDGHGYVVVWANIANQAINSRLISWNDKLYSNVFSL